MPENMSTANFHRMFPEAAAKFLVQEGINSLATLQLWPKAKLERECFRHPRIFENITAVARAHGWVLLEKEPSPFFNRWHRRDGGFSTPTQMALHYLTRIGVRDFSALCLFNVEGLEQILHSNPH